MTASVWLHIANFHLPYLREFQNLGWETHVGCCGITADAPFTDHSIDLPFQKKILSSANFHAARMIRNLVRQESYDLIITHTTLAAFFTRLAVKGMKERPRLINVMHVYLFDDGTAFVKRAVLFAAEKLTAPETDLLLTMNEWDYTFAKKHLLGKRIEKIPGMGVDFSKLDGPTKEDGILLRQKLGIPDDAFVLIYPAEFSKRKNQQVLIKALRSLPENVWLVLCGKGDLLEDCRQLAGKLQVKERVLFPGHAGNIAEWYRMADAAVSSSRSEGLPFNIMEAMYMGLPVVAGAVKGHTDLIRNGENGFLYPYGHEKQLRECVCLLAQCRKLRTALGKEAKQSVTQYELSCVLPGVLNCYLDLLC